MDQVTFTTRGALGKTSLREANERVVLMQILRQPGISRLEIVRTTGLSPSAITGIIDRLKAQNLLAEEKIETTLVGRPPSALYLRADTKLAIGVEIEPNEASIAAGLQNLFAMSDAERAAMGSRARVLVESRFTWEQVGRQMRGVHEWILGGGIRPNCVLDA